MQNPRAVHAAPEAGVHSRQACRIGLSFQYLTWYFWTPKGRLMELVSDMDFLTDDW